MKRMFFIVFIAASLLVAKSNYYTSPHINEKLIQEYIKELDKLDNEQKTILEWVFRKGLEYNIGYTAVAIAWEESHFGVHCVNEITGDYGIMGINLHWFLVDRGLDYKNYWVRSKWKTKLIRDDEFNINYGIDRILYWYNKSNGNWYKTWASYNGGNRLVTKNYKYAYRILNRIIAFRKWLKLNK